MTARLSRRGLGLAAGGALLLMAGAVVADQAAPAPDDQVAIANFAFGPARLTVVAGTKVTWVNRDEEPHTVNSVDPAAVFKSAALDTDDRFSFVFNRPGSYKYFCSIHPYMVGTIVVK
jgi:plastocyanin